MIFRVVFRKFPENINKTLIAARMPPATDVRNVLCVFELRVADNDKYLYLAKILILFEKFSVFSSPIWKRTRALFLKG